MYVLSAQHRARANERVSAERVRHGFDALQRIGRVQGHFNLRNAAFYERFADGHGFGRGNATQDGNEGPGHGTKLL